MRGVIAAALATGIMLVAGTSAAQQVGSTFATTQSRFVLSAERLFGLSFTHETQEIQVPPGTPEQERKTTTTNIGLGTNVLIHSPYVQPQFAFDVFVIDHLSVGVGLAYWQAGGEQEDTGEPSQDLADIAFFRFTPRVGYGMMFTDIIGLWARGGLTYYNLSAEDDDGDQSSTNGLAITLEGLLMISPIDHVGIHLGPTFDIGISGEQESDPADPGEPTVSVDNTQRQFGAMAGLSVWF